jgi:electron transfer flavoprotein alpha subunit
VQAAALAAEAALVLLAAGRSASALAPRLALRLGAGYFEDASALRIVAGGWEGERSAFLSRANLTIRSEAPLLVATLRPGAFAPLASLGPSGTVHQLSAPEHAADRRAIAGEVRAAERGRVTLEEAERVVCGGRGLGSTEAYSEHVLGLADQLGAASAATRAVVDAGWRPYHEQVGQTGKSVTPKLYIALGLSGAVQHLSGMNRSGVVVAVNKDPDAPIFKAADYAVVADVATFVPALRRALSEQG